MTPQSTRSSVARSPNRWGAGVQLIDATTDIIHERVERAAPTWAVTRGWVDYLLQLDDSAVHVAEMRGPASWFVVDPTCPPRLRDLAEATLSACEIPNVSLNVDTSRGANTADSHGVGRRKQSQVDVITQLVEQQFSHVERVIDIGAGHGHLTRRVASQLDVDAIAIERDPARVAVGRALASDRIRYLQVDALDDDARSRHELHLSSRTLLLALHGCGALGDAIVKTAAQHDTAVLLVGCCPQKIPTEARFSLSPSPSPLRISRDVLGLANVLPRENGVERPMADEMIGREARLGLRLFLERRGIHGEPGDEMHGINRRRARAGIDALIDLAATQRGLAPASTAEREEIRASARDALRVARRLSLPRNMLGRALEVFIARDRAAFLRNAGHGAHVVTLFDPTVSPRNLAILAQPRRRLSRS